MARILKPMLETNGQDHLLQFYEELTELEKDYLTKEIEKINIEKVCNDFRKAINLDNNKLSFNRNISPIPYDVMESSVNSSLSNLIYYENLGLKEIADGKVAVILLAGGQGTRLGVDYPKGMYNINLPSNRTLFHLQALRIRRLQNMAKEKFGTCKNIVWYIMTSEATHDVTVNYFAENKYFGLDKTNIILFKQNSIPCFTLDGKILLDEKYKISKAPDGNGGLYSALKEEKILDDMRHRNIRNIHVFSVDNVLVKVADPIFLGYCLSRSADCGVKVVEKRSPDEAVGVVCQVDGKYTVLEYSEIEPNLANLRDDNDVLVFNAGNICNHYFTITFLDKIVEQYLNNIDLHVAKKRIPYLNTKGEKCKPSNINGIKIEKFIFDIFKYSENFVAWKVCREDEFSALKNSDTAKFDCPLTAQKDILNLHKKWLLNAGAVKVENNVEVCPLISYSGENLSNLAKNKIFKGPLLLM